MNRPDTLMIAGGGTGGHVYPAIAIAREYLARDATRRVVFVGTERGLEKTIVPKAGFPLELVNVGGLKDKSLGVFLTNLACLPVAFIQGWKLVGKHSPDVALGVGGYSSGPVLLAAAMRGVPTVIHEQNAFPGIANRALARVAKAVAVGYADAVSRLGRADAIVTGNPVRSEFFAAAGPRLVSGDARKQLLIFGGSQGARALNRAMTGALQFLGRLKDRIHITHQTGANDLETVRQAYRESAFPEANVVSYLDPMVDEIAAAQLVVCRAGATTLGELAAIGRAAILIPLPASDNHQEFNARVVERAGGAMVITEADLTPERLALAVSEIINDPDRARRMGEFSRTLAEPDAAKKIVDLLEKFEKRN